jgi:hypothetical protein
MNERFPLGFRLRRRGARKKTPGLAGWKSPVKEREGTMQGAARAPENSLPEAIRTATNAVLQNGRFFSDKSFVTSCWS